MNEIFKQHTGFLIWCGSACVLALTLTLLLNGFYEREAAHLSQLEKKEHHLTSEILTLKEDMAFLEDNRSRFESLLHIPLDRRATTHIIEELAQKHHLNQVDYTLIPLEASGHFKGYHVQLTFSGVLDTDVFQFIHELSLRLPGHNLPRAFSLFREGSLDALSLDDRPTLVRGEYFFDWMSCDTVDPT